MEIWKDIYGYEGLYKISPYGEVKIMFYRNGKSCIPMERKASIRFNSRGYPFVDMYKNGNRERKFIHRLVAEAFIRNPLNKQQVNHKDGNKKNNHVSNLEWVTASENMLHAYKTGLHRRKSEIRKK